MTPREELIEKLEAIIRDASGISWPVPRAAQAALNLFLDAALAECNRPQVSDILWVKNRPPTVAEIIGRLEKLKER